jgi:hypothetical protein
MTKRSILYIVVGIDVLYIAMLAVCAFLIGPLYRADFVAMRTKIEASSSLEDLRPRALHAIGPYNPATERLNICARLPIN